MAVVGVVAVTLVANLGALGQGAGYLRQATSTEKAELGALELARGRAQPLFFPDLIRLTGLAAYPYFAAVDELGSPAFTPGELPGVAEPSREAADVVSIRLNTSDAGLPRVPAGGAAPAGPPAVDVQTGGVVRKKGACAEWRPTRFQAPGSPPDFQLTMPAGGVELRVSGDAPLLVHARRFALSFPTRPLGTLAAGSTTRIRFPDEGVPQPWHLGMKPSGPVRACALA